MVTGNDVMYDSILGELREADISGGTGGGSGGYADSAGFAYTAGELQSGATVNGATVTFSNIPQSAVDGLSDSLAGKQDKIVSGATFDINITGSAGYATTAGTAGALSAGVVVASATNATSATNAASATSAGSATSATNATSATSADSLTSGAAVDGATVTFTNIPQSAVTGLETALSGKSDIISGGYRTTVTSSGGSATVAQDKWFPITNVTGNAVTMQPGEAYVIRATTAAVTINTTTVPVNQYGLESHLEIFVANTGYVVTGSNVVLANALEPDSVNNCTVRFHDGLAIISVEDHVAGYIVTVNAASGAGSLNYGLATASNGYISINASLNGQTLDLGGVVTSAGEKHVVGNGYAETVVSGGITCTSKTTFSNLSMLNVVVNGGTMTLGDVFIPNGSTVAVGGGGLAVEKVLSDNGVINLGGTTKIIPTSPVYVSGATITGGYASGAELGDQNGGAVNVFNTTAVFHDCVFSGNSAARNGGAIAMEGSSARAYFSNCLFESNSAPFGSKTAVHINFGYGEVKDCTFKSQNIMMSVSGGFVGSNALQGTTRVYGFNTGRITIQSGAILNMSGNNGSSFVFTGFAEITFGDNVTAITSGGTSVLLNGGTAGSCTVIKNDGTIS